MSILYEKTMLYLCKGIFLYGYFSVTNKIKIVCESYHF